jgi:succinyl-CoA synthetase beta subunit
MRDLMRVGSDLGLDQQKSFMTFIVKHMYDLMVERDCEKIEINPLVLTKDNHLFVNHAKIKVDRNSSYRQQEIIMRRDLS